MERFGDVFGAGFAIEGIFFFTEAIFIAIYIYGWKRLEGWKHFWTGVPIVDRRDRRRLQRRRRQLVDEPARGLQARRRRQRRRRRAARRPVQPGDRLRVPAHAARRLHGLSASGSPPSTRSRCWLKRAPHERRHRVGFAIPFAIAAIADPDAALRRRHRRPRRRRPPAVEVRRHGMHPEDRARPDRVDRRHLHQTTASSRDRHPRARLAAGRLQHRTRSSPASTTSPTTSSRRRNTLLHLAVRRDGRDRVRAARARRLVRLGRHGGTSGSYRRRAGFCAPRRSAGSARCVALEAGWIVTEVGRQPWIVQGFDADLGGGDPGPGAVVVFGGAVVLYATLAVVRLQALRQIARRGSAGRRRPAAPTAAPARRGPEPEAAA